MKKLHVISFDVPYPANYGGVIVVYNQLKAWKAAGVKVILHAYRYGKREKQPHLESICEEVYYYERATGWKSAVSSLPYIVNSRKSMRLLDRLKEDDYPIFFEGIHTTALIAHPALKGRKKALRMHNIEWKYYRSLEKLGANIWKRFYYNQEARRLEKYDEKVMAHVDALFSISGKDQAHYEELHEACYHLPAAHGEKLDILEGTGAYYLFHGKLSVEDNKHAAMLLMHELFANSDKQFIIAGLDPDKELLEAAGKLDNVQVKGNVSEDEMKSLLQNAQANILYTTQDNGLKLKLLHALHIGRHCIVNTAMVSNAPSLAPLCAVGADLKAMKVLLEDIDNQPFTERRIRERESILADQYDNEKNTKIALNILYKLGFN